MRGEPCPPDVLDEAWRDYTAVNELNRALYDAQDTADSPYQRANSLRNAPHGSYCTPPASDDTLRLRALLGLPASGLFGL